MMTNVWIVMIWMLWLCLWTTTTTTTVTASASSSSSSVVVWPTRTTAFVKNHGENELQQSLLLKMTTQLRGGEVLEPTTLQDVEALLLKAGSNNQLIVIDFTATWCGPCKMIAPVFKELSESFPGVMFLKVDVDENPDTAAKYSVSAMPTFVFIKGGEVVDRLMGANPAHLEKLIDEHK